MTHRNITWHPTAFSRTLCLHGFYVRHTNKIAPGVFCSTNMCSLNYWQYWFQRVIWCVIYFVVIDWVTSWRSYKLAYLMTRLMSSQTLALENIQHNCHNECVAVVVGPWLIKQLMGAFRPRRTMRPRRAMMHTRNSDGRDAITLCIFQCAICFTYFVFGFILINLRTTRLRLLCFDYFGWIVWQTQLWQDVKFIFVHGDCTSVLSSLAPAGYCCSSQTEYLVRQTVTHIHNMYILFQVPTTTTLQCLCTNFLFYPRQFQNALFLGELVEWELNCVGEILSSILSEHRETLNSTL